MRPPASARPTAPPPALELHECLAKSRDLNGATVPGRSVEEHCRISGAVAAELAKRFTEACPGLLPAGAELPALTHDVGKVCPTFQAKIYEAAQKPRPPALKNADPALERQWGGHAQVSCAALHAYRAPDAIARIVGGHHGRSSEKPGVYDAHRPSFGGTQWQDKRKELLNRLLPKKPQWPHLDDEARERMLCGLTITADWIASSAIFDDPHEDWQPLISQAVDEAGFRWPQVLPGLGFQDIFGFAPRPAQSALIDAIQSPGVYVLEAPMGLGKTEAALYAAYRMLEQRKSSGIYFALPTRLTSNRIHVRANQFLARIFAGHESALLLHGQAWLERFAHQQLGKHGAPNKSWFSQGKRGILAPFAVGTVDQALLSPMHVRHGALRTFGLAGKTVILDEVHSYDAYTGGILDALVAQLRRLNCTVIILSATLTAERRAALIGQQNSSTDYPLISAAPQAGSLTAIPCEAPAESQTLLGHPASDEEAMEEALLRAEGGQRVLWIENTVGEAQARWRLLAARAKEMGDLPCGLLHSRFTPADRERGEEHWVAHFAHNAPGRGTRGALLIGTQVLEQSLDLDADFLITRFCPTDMLLQRLGRLWRHADTQRPPGAQREAWLLHPALEHALEKPRSAFGSSGYVYEPYVLTRSLELWHERSAISLPSEIRPIIEATYAAREQETAPMRAALANMQKKVQEQRDLAQRAQATTLQAASDDENDPPTRLNERKELSVLLLRHCDDAARSVTLPDGAVLNLQTGADSGQWLRRSRTAAALLRHVVRVPEKLAPASTPPKWFEPWLHCQQLRVGLLDEGGAVLELNRNAQQRRLRYSSEQGYCEWKN